MLSDLAGKVVCITGGTGLIGQEIAKGFVDAKSKVYVGTRSPHKYQNKENLTYLKLDILNQESIDNFIQQVQVLNSHIDVWINSAWPLVEGSAGDFTQINSNIVKEDVNGHIMGFYNCTKSIFPLMIERKRGSIINYGSIYGELSPDFRIYEGTEIKSSPGYSMIKGAIHSFTKYLACLGGPHQVRVNAICPGGVLNAHSSVFQKQYSHRIPLRRMANKEEMIGPALFLASNMSTYVTGQLLYVDGGLTAW